MAGDSVEMERKPRSGLFWVGVAGVVLFVCLCLGAAAVGLGGYMLFRESERQLDNFEFGSLVGEALATSPAGDIAAGETAVPSPTPPATIVPAPTKELKLEVTRMPETAVSPMAPTQQESSDYTDIQNIDLSLLYEVWNLIEERFDGELPPEEVLLQALINGSISTLEDEYTRYIVPQVATRLREDMGGSVSGIGAFVTENSDGLMEIVAPISGQPAELAGLLPGDVIVGVNGQSVIGFSFDEVLLMVRGPAGTQVTLEIVRQGEEEPLFFTITRARFEVPVVEAEMLEGNVAYIRLLEFNQLATERTAEALSDLLAQNPQGLVLDLRNNPGGFLNQSVSVADLFLPEAVILLERNNQGLDEIFSAVSGEIGETIPMVVLVNRGSASASEIVAGALQDNGRAIVMGETSFGKGSVQQVFALSNGGELRVTIARWYTPNNVSISDNGITPDIVVEMPLDVRFRSPEDVQLQRAVDYLLNGE